jgi:hypothetical protein
MLLIAALALTGVLAGTYVSAAIHDHRVADLTAGQYVAMHQMRDKTFRRVMPPFALATIGIVIATAIFGAPSVVARTLSAIAAVLLITDIVLTVRRQLPLNQEIQSWTEATIPGDWAQTRDKWTANHSIRAVLGVSAFLCVLIATWTLLR